MCNGQSLLWPVVLSVAAPAQTNKQAMNEIHMLAWMLKTDWSFWYQLGVNLVWYFIDLYGAR